MTEARRRFSVSTPDWGGSHLCMDAIVAFVDDELTAGAQARATHHLAHCPDCAKEVVAQGQARMLLRSAQAPGMSSSLLSSLRSIPQDADLPAPPAGLAMTADGQLVSVLRPEPPPRSSAGPPAGRPVSPVTHGRRPGSWIRLGAGAAVSGLALGALALGPPSASVDVRTPVPGADRGVLGGTVRGHPGQVGAVLDTRLDPAVPPASATPTPTPTPTSSLPPSTPR